MNHDYHLLDAYFSGQTSPAEERSLAQILANDPTLADQFVEQARLDALLGEIFTDQPAGKFHETLVARLMTGEQLKPVAKPSTKVIRGPFPYWKQVAAVVALGLFLWGISSVWYGASQLAEANPRKKASPRVASVEAPALATADQSPSVEQDRELEAWLRKYFVGAQPVMERSLEDWLVALVEQEFPKHNHLNKHRNLTWEIRAANPESKEKLARQNVRLQCTPGSLLDQVRGLAALAGCDVHVEPDTLVLTPMKESSTAVEAREIMLSAAFVNGETLVSSPPIAQQVTTWQDINIADIALADSRMDGIASDYIINSNSDPNPISLAATRILQSGIDWPKGSEVTAVMPVLEPIVSSYADSTITYNLPQSTESEATQLLSYAGSHFMDLNSGTNGLMVTNGIWGGTPGSMAFKVNLQTSPRGFHQLEILNQLPKAATIEPKLTITDHTFAANQAPLAKDRVLVGNELSALTEAYRGSALSSIPVDTQPENEAQPFSVATQFTSTIPTSYSWIDLPSLQTPMVGATFASNGQTEPLPDVEVASNSPTTPDVTATWSFRAAPVPTSQANLSLTRSGELLKISGAINVPATAPAVAANTQTAQIQILREYSFEDVTAETIALGDEPIDDGLTRLTDFGINVVAPPAPPAGVDISLSLFPGQGAIVTGPTTDGKVHYYLLKRAE